MQNPEPTESELAFAQKEAQTPHTQVGFIGRRNTTLQAALGSTLILGSLGSLGAFNRQVASEVQSNQAEDERARVQSGQASIEARAKLERLRKEAREANALVVGRTKGGTIVRKHQKPKSAQAPFTLHAKETTDNNNYKIGELCANDALSSAIALMGVALETGGSVKLKVTDATGKEVFKVEVEGFQSGLEIPLMDDIRAANEEEI